MNRQRFEEAKKEIVKLCYEQDSFNGKDLREYRPSHRDLPEEIASKIAEFGNALIDAKIIYTARKLIAAADDSEFVKEPFDTFVKDIHFRDDGTAEIEYNDGTIGKVEKAFSLKAGCEGWLIMNATRLNAGNS